MAFRANDGKAFGNRQKMNAYNERDSVKNHPAKRPDKDASDERTGHQRREYGGSLETKPRQAPEEVRTQDRRGENTARNPNPGPREPKASAPDVIEGAGVGNPDSTPGGNPEAPNTRSPFDNDISHMHISDAVAAHGPAQSVQVRSSPSGGHHVISVHGGRSHVSTHPTPHSAALHVGDAMGLNQATAQLAGQPSGEDQIPGMGGGEQQPMRTPRRPVAAMPRY